PERARAAAAEPRVVGREERVVEVVEVVRDGLPPCAPAEAHDEQHDRCERRDEPGVARQWSRRDGRDLGGAGRPAPTGGWGGGRTAGPPAQRCASRATARGLTRRAPARCVGPGPAT